MTLIKSISGIRGTIGGAQGDNLTPIDIVKFTTAYVRFIGEKVEGRRLRIVVGRDARISGEMVNDIIEGTLLGCGDIYKVDVDAEEELARLFKVRSIPTLVYIPTEGLPIVELGGKGKGELKEKLDALK